MVLFKWGALHQCGIFAFLPKGVTLRFLNSIFPKAKGQKSNASTKVPITKDLELPQDAPGTDVVVVEVEVLDADAIRGEAPNNQLSTTEVL